MTLRALLIGGAELPAYLAARSEIDGRAVAASDAGTEDGDLAVVRPDVSPLVVARLRERGLWVLTEDSSFETPPTIDLEAKDDAPAVPVRASLAASIAHEVNNPLALLMANVSSMQGLLDEIETLTRLGHREASLGALFDVARALVTDDAQAVSRIAAVTRGLQHLSELELERDAIRLVSLNQIVNSAAGFVYNQVRHRARLIKDLGDVPPIAVAEGKLERLVSDLILEAAGAIDESADSDDFIEVKTSVRGGNVVLSVIHGGEHVVPFAAPALAARADVVRQHRGHVRVTSDDRTARFDAILPLDTGLVPSASCAERVAPRVVQGTGGRRVLLIDDETMILRAYQRVLGTSYDVVTVPGGAEALDLLRFDRSFDAIVCDMMMPHVDGPTVYQRLEEIAPELRDRVIFCSGGVFTSKATSFAGKVANRMLSKPIGAEDLKAAVARVVGS
jgi:CheY-like chemotaxis protein